MTSDGHSGRSGFILADALGGLGVLAAGLAAFLACMSESHRLIARAEAVAAARAELSLRMALPASGSGLTVLRAPSIQPLPSPQRLTDVGVGLCEQSAEVRDRQGRVWTSRTVRFCVREAGASS